MAWWYQSPWRSQTDSMLSVRHCSRSVVAQASRIWSVAVTPGETGHDRGHDAASWPGCVQVSDVMDTCEAAFGPVESAEEPTLAGFERSVVSRAYKSLPERWQAVLWY